MSAMPTPEYTDPRAAGNKIPPEEVWLSALRRIYQAIPVLPLTPMQSGRIRQRWTTVEGNHIHRARLSWQVAFSLTGLLLLVLAIIPAFPRLALPGSNDLQAPMAGALRNEETDTSSASMLQGMAPLIPPPEPVFDPSKTGVEGARQYDSVTVAVTGADQLAALLASGSVTAAPDGSLLLAQGPDRARVDGVLPSVDGVVVIRGSFLASAEMPAGRDLLVLTSQAFLHENMASLAWKAFLAQAWPWGLLALLASLVFLYLHFRSPRWLWLALFLGCLFLALLWPLLAPAGSSHWLILSSSQTAPTSWNLTLQSGGVVSLVDPVPSPQPSPRERGLVEGGFRLPLREDVTPDLTNQLSSYGLQPISAGDGAGTGMTWTFLPQGQAFLVQALLLGLLALCFFLPLVLFVGLTLTRKAPVGGLIGQDGTP
jgi:hypothetical protein